MRTWHPKARRVRARRRNCTFASILLLAGAAAVSCGGDDAEPVTTARAPLELGDPVVRTAPHGRIEGRSAVTHTGAFTYSIPLKVPKGIAGATPSLSLEYSSQAGNGPLGVGWSIGGTSVIKRCKRTVSIHGVATSLSDADGALLDTGPYCLDGQPLIPVSRNGNTIRFKLERDDNSRITGTDLDEGGRFTVEKPDGRVLTYGGNTGMALVRVHRVTETPANRHPFAWYLATERFPGGAVIGYHYEAEEGELASNASRVLSSVSYGTEASAWRVNFIYSDGRTDGLEIFEDGFRTANRKRLDKIEIWGPAPTPSGGYEERLAWSYSLTYWTVPSRFTGRTLLWLVTLCDGLGGCLPPTNFMWNDYLFPGTQPLEDDYEIWSTAPGPTVDPLEFTKLTLADLNGDGRDDLIYGDGRYTDYDPSDFHYFYRNTNNLRVRFSYEPHGVDGLWSEYVANVGPVNPHTIRVGDFNSDGGAEVFMAPWGTPAFFRLSSMPPSPNQLFSSVTDLNNALVPLYPNSGMQAYRRCITPDLPCKGIADLIALGDLDGDGTIDVLRKGIPSDVWPNDSQERGFMVNPRSYDTRPVEGEFWTASGPEPFMLVDVTGDGKTEPILRPSANPVGDPVTVIQLPNRLLSPGCLLSDMNGDGLKDLVCLRTRRKVEVSRNTGRGFLPLVEVMTLPADQWPASSDPAQAPYYALQMKDRVVSADFDGDGREDLLLLDYAAVRTPIWGAVQAVSSPMALLLARGDGYQLRTIAATANIARLMHTGKIYAGTAVGDVDGDGLPEIVLLRSEQGLQSSIYVIRGKRPRPPEDVQDLEWPRLTRRDVIIGIADGLKVGQHGWRYRERINYADLPSLAERRSKSTYQPCAWTNGARCVSRGPLVVSGHAVDRYVAPENFTSYSYEEGVFDPAGRGFLGFKKIVAADPVFATRTTTTYDLQPRDSVANTTFDPPGLRSGPFVPAYPTNTRLFPFMAVPSQVQEVTGGFYATPSSSLPGPVQAACSLSTRHVVFNDTDKTYQVRTGSTCVDKVYRASLAPSSYGSLCTQTADVRQCTRVTEWDSYGNPTKVTHETTGGTTRVVETKYNNHTGSHWKIGEPRIVTETLTKGTSTIKRKRRYAWYSSGENAGLLESEWTLPSTASDSATFPPAPTSEDADDLDLYHRTQYAYGVLGSVTEIREEAFDKSRSGRQLRTVTFRYDEPAYALAYPTEVIDALGRRTTLEFHPTLGVLLESRDPNQVVTRYSYDGLGRPRGSAIQGGPTTVTTYGAIPTAQGAYVVTTTSSTDAVSKRVIDYLGRVTTTSRLLVDGTYSEQHVTYTPRGDVHTVSLPRVAGSSGSAPVTTYEYDALGRVVRISRPGIADEIRQYPTAFDATVFLGGLGGYQRFDVDGYLTSTLAYYESALRPGVLGTQTRFTYDAAGNPLTVKLAGTGGAVDERYTRTMTYDELGRRRTLQDPGSGSHEYRYNGFGEVRWYKDSSSTLGERRLVRDDLGRIVRNEGFGSPREDEHYVWDAGPNAIGKLSGSRSVNVVDGVEGESIERFYRYDQNGRLYEYGISDGPVNDGTPTYAIRVEQFDASGRPEVIRYPNKILLPGDNVARTITNPVAIKRIYQNGYLKKIQTQPGVIGGGSSVQMLWELRQATPLRIETASGNNTIDSIDFRPTDGRPSLVKIGNVQSYAYEYDGHGDLKKRTAMNGDVDEFGYDTLGRLEIVKYTRGSARARREHWLDDFGNVTAVRTYDQHTGGTLLEERTFEIGRPSWPYVVWKETGPAPRNFVYDGRGRRVYAVGDVISIAKYNHRDLPVSISASGFPSTKLRYDADGRRAFRSQALADSTIETTYYLDDVFEDRNGSTRTYVAKIKANGQTVAVVKDTFGATATPTRAVVYPHYDIQGSVIAVNGAEGTQKLYYDVFGQRVTQDGRTPAPDPASVIREGFTGHEHDSLPGGQGPLINMKGRIYDPLARRFLTPDPIVGRPTSVQGWNPYAYALNNPTRYTDPTGYDPPRGKVPVDVIWVVVEGWRPEPGSNFGLGHGGPSVGPGWAMAGAPSAGQSNAEGHTSGQEVVMPPMLVTSEMHQQSVVKAQAREKARRVRELQKDARLRALHAKKMADAAREKVELDEKVRELIQREHDRMRREALSELATSDVGPPLRIPPGYIDINISAGAWIGVTGGVFITRLGVNGYLGGGAMTPGVSGSISLSPDTPSPGMSSGQLQVGIPVGGNIEIIGAVGEDEAGNTFREIGVSYSLLGGGAMLPSASATGYYTW